MTQRETLRKRGFSVCERPAERYEVLFNPTRSNVPSILPSSGLNRLLTALPGRDRQHFIARCEPVDLAFAKVLAEPGEHISQVYFPSSSLISLTTAPIDGCARMEVGLIGDEGMLGITLLLGIDVSPLHALVQAQGSALRMDAAPFCRTLEQSPALLAELKKYLFILICQLAQSAACTRFHVVEARLARWLLMMQDRAHSNELHVTQEFLADMLGVRRVGVTKTASSLQRKKLICYSRGNITILDRAGLETASCACYKADKMVYSRIMKTP